MKKLTLVWIALLVTGSLAAQEFKVNTDESVIEWKGEKIVGNSHTGTINFTSGMVKVKGSKLVGGEFVADMTTIKEDKGSERLVGHLKSDDFFGVETYPTAKLVITKVEKGDQGLAKITARLTIKESTEEITFPASIDIQDGYVAAGAELTFDRSKFDVRYGSNSFFDNLGDKAISNDIKLNVKLKATK